MPVKKKKTFLDSRVTMRQAITNQHLPSGATCQGGINHLLIVDAEHVDPTVLS